LTKGANDGGAPKLDKSKEKKPAKNYVDSGEGPFNSKREAQDFADAEVGVPFQIKRGEDGKWGVHVEQHEFDEPEAGGGEGGPGAEGAAAIPSRRRTATSSTR
jgi:hypothetical protein